MTFIEIYNETIRDLLREVGAAEGKHEIKKDAGGSTYVTDVRHVDVDPNDNVQVIITRTRTLPHFTLTPTLTLTLTL